MAETFVSRQSDGPKRGDVASSKIELVGYQAHGSPSARVRHFTHADQGMQLYVYARRAHLYSEKV